MSECPSYKELEAQIVELKRRIASLSRIISDLSGPAMLEMDDDPYEDEQPLVREDDK